MINRLQQGLLAVIILATVACGGGGGGKKSSSSSSSVVASSAATSVAESSMAASSVAESSIAASSVSSAMSSVETSSTAASESSSSSSAAVTTTFNVTITSPLGGEPVVNRSWSEKILDFFVGEALADGEDVPLANLAVVVVDLAGNVIETIPLNESNSTQNPDGSWSITVPGYPQLDCIVIANLDGPITLVSTNNIFDLYPNALFSPTTDEDLDVDIASTAAYQNLLNELGGDGTFESLGLDVNDPTQLAVLENLIQTVRQVIEDQVFVGAANIAEALAEIQAQVIEIVQVEATNVTSAVTSTLRDAIETGGGIHWYEAFDLQEILHGAIIGEAPETEYMYNGTAFETLTEDSFRGDLILGATGWVESADSISVTALNEDGSITVSDIDVASNQMNVKADQAFDLGGRNITEFFGAYTDTRAIVGILNPTSTFAEGSVGYRARVTVINDNYSLWYQPGNAEGICPWNKDGDQEPDLASEYGGNCETVGVWTYIEGQQTPQHNSAVTSLASLKSADVVYNTTGSKLIGIGWPGGGDSSLAVAVQLVDNDQKTANYYLYDWNTNQGTLIGQGIWAEIALPNLEGEAATAITLSLPGTVEEEGDFSSDELNKLFAVHNGFVRPGERELAGELSELGFLLINGTASDSVMAAANYKAPNVGSWLDEDTQGATPAVLTFINNLQYTVTSFSETECSNGLETGFYQVDGGSLSANPEVEADGDCGLSSLTPDNTVAVEGNTLTITEGEDVFTFTRLANTDIRGTWIGMEPDGDHQLILSLLPNNRFLFSQHGTTDTANGNNGYEYGTYTYNLVNGSFNPVVEINRDGQWGFSDSEAAYTINVEANTMTITVAEGVEEFNVNLTRVGSVAE